MFFLSFTLYGQEKLFYLGDFDFPTATKEKENTIQLILNKEVFNNILQNRVKNKIIEIPYITGKLKFKLDRFDFYKSDIKFISKTNRGDEKLDIIPTLLSYTMILDGNDVGIINFVNNKIVASFKLENKQFEITEFNGKYILFEATNSINSSNFSCAVENNYESISPPISQLPQSTPVCVELAIEIDFYTRQTFNSDLESINWALAIFAGVSQIYESETNAAIQVNYTYIWNTVDPYSVFIAQSSAMLSELKNYWQTNNAGINRDLVHLLTKRTNTGTGGIAYLDVLCDNNFGYGFSAELNNDTTYNFPNPTYTWNLGCCSHELGHNFGANHTHWCGWVNDPLIPFAGGVIDNCVAVEGSCSNNPSPQLGTIMSYCHTTSGGAILDFHEVVVSQALNPGISNASCLTICDYYGCTDPLAFNYNATATVDDGSCIPIIFGCIDILATNYNLLANTDDGSCTFCSDISFNVSNISCNDYNDGAINLIINNGNPPFSFNWIGPNGYSANTQNLNNLQYDGNYSVIVTDAIQCNDTSIVTLYNPDTISIQTISISQVTCNGLNNGSFNLTPIGGTPPYSINYGTNNPSQLSAGIYSVAISDINNCPAYNTDVIITEPSVLTESIIIENISCNNLSDGSINLSISGGTFPYSSIWTGLGGFYSTNEDVFQLLEDTYSVVITDVYNCSIVVEAIITNPLPLQYNITSQDVSCNSGDDGSISLNISGGIAPYNYLWNNSSIAQNLSSISAGSYSVNVTDDNGCALPTIYTNIIEPNPSTIIETHTNVSCFGYSTGSINISYTPVNNNISYNYEWQGPNSFTATTADINLISAGLYTLNITENNNCVIISYFDITEPDQLSAVEVVEPVSCKSGDDGSSSLIIIGGTPFYTINWNGANPLALSSGIYFYSISDNNQCIFNDSIVITEPPTSIQIIDSVVPVSCFNGSDGQAFLDPSGGGTPYSINWLNSNPLNLNAGTHYFELEDSYNCLLLDSVIINQPLKILVNEIIANSKCYGESSGSAILNISGGVAPYANNWFGANNLSLLAGSYPYNITDDNNCSFSGIVIIQQPNDIIVSTIVTPSSCPSTNDGSVAPTIVGGIPPYNINWAGVNPANLISGNYEFTVIDSNLCIDSNQVIVYPLSNITVQPTIDNISCFGKCNGEISLFISNGIFPYQIEILDINSNYQTENSLCKGWYTYNISDALSCLFVDSFEILSPNKLEGNILYQGNTLEAIVIGGTSPYYYEWYDINGYIGSSSTIPMLFPGAYSCLVYDSESCLIDTLFINTEVLSMNTIEEDKFLVYPNPSSGLIYINFNGTLNETLRLNIKNYLGQSVYSKDIYNNKNIIQMNLDVLSSGVYHLCFSTENTFISKKIVIQNIE